MLLGYELYVLCVLALEGGVYTVLHARENCIWPLGRDNNIEEEGSIKEADYL